MSVTLDENTARELLKQGRSYKRRAERIKGVKLVSETALSGGVGCSAGSFLCEAANGELSIMSETDFTDSFTPARAVKEKKDNLHAK